MCLGVPGKLVQKIGDDPLFLKGTVDFSGVQREVSLSCLPDAEIGDYVVVHVGFAIAKLSVEAAEQALSEIRQVTTGEFQPCDM